jgi:hypothetical protein
MGQARPSAGGLARPNDPVSLDAARLSVEPLVRSLACISGWCDIGDRRPSVMAGEPRRGFRMGRSGKLRSVAIGIGVATALLVCVAQAFGSGRYTRASAARATPARFAMTVSHGMVIRAWWRLRGFFSLPGVDNASSGLYWGSLTFNAPIRHGHFAKEIDRGSRSTDLSGAIVGNTATATLTDYFAVGPFDSNGWWNASHTFTLRKVAGGWESVQPPNPQSGLG